METVIYITAGVLVSFATIVVVILRANLTTLRQLNGLLNDQLKELDRVSSERNVTIAARDITILSLNGKLTEATRELGYEQHYRSGLRHVQSMILLLRLQKQTCRDHPKFNRTQLMRRSEELLDEVTATFCRTYKLKEVPADITELRQRID